MSTEYSASFSQVEVGGMFSGRFDPKSSRHRETLAQANIVGHINFLLRAGDIQALAAIGGTNENDPFSVLKTVTSDTGNKGDTGLDQKA